MLTECGSNFITAALLAILSNSQEKSGNAYWPHIIRVQSRSQSSGHHCPCKHPYLKKVQFSGNVQYDGFFSTVST